MANFQQDVKQWLKTSFNGTARHIKEYNQCKQISKFVVVELLNVTLWHKQVEWYTVMPTQLIEILTPTLKQTTRLITAPLENEQLLFCVHLLQAFTKSS